MFKLRALITYIIAAAVLVSQIPALAATEIVKCYSILKYEYSDFIEPLYNSGASEREMKIFFEDLEVGMNKYNDINENNILTYLQDETVVVAQLDKHRNFAAILYAVYGDELTEYLSTGIIPDNLRSPYDAMAAIILGTRQTDKYSLIDKYEAYLNEFLIDAGKYTPSAVEKFRSVLTNTVGVLENRDASQEEIDSAYSVLETGYIEWKASNSPAQNGDSAGGGAGGGAGGAGGEMPPADNTTPDDKLPGDSENLSEQKKVFSDVSEGLWYYNAVMSLSEKGIISGFDDGSFKPGAYVTREQIAKMICLAINAEINDGISTTYIDVNTGHWYARYVSTMTELGVVNGVGDGKFGVGDNLTRQDMAVICYRLIEKGIINKTAAEESEVFYDIDQASDYAKEAIINMKNMHIINGVGDNTFNPLGMITRAEAAQIIYGLIN